MGEILGLDFNRVLFTELNSCGIVIHFKVIGIGKLPRKEVKSSSVHNLREWQGPCTAFHLPSALLISLYLLFSPPIPFRQRFISSLLRHFYYLNCENTRGPESLQGVISCLHSCWERIYHLLKHWGYELWLFFSAGCSTLLVLFIHPG